MYDESEVNYQHQRLRRDANLRQIERRHLRFIRRTLALFENLARLILHVDLDILGETLHQRRTYPPDVIGILRRRDPHILESDRALTRSDPLSAPRCGASR